MRSIHESVRTGEVLTGVLYVEEGAPTLVDRLNLIDQPLTTLPESRVRPGPEALAQVMEEFR